MIIHWLRTTKVAAVLLLIIRLYLGYSWISHGLEKITGGFTAQNFMSNIVASPVTGTDGSELYPWFTWFIEHLAMPATGFLNFMVPIGELAIGLGFIFGTFTQLACFFALLLNFSFFFGGTVSENPKFILLQIFIIVAGANAGRIGLDRWVIPFIRRYLFRIPEEKWVLIPENNSESLHSSRTVKNATAVDINTAGAASNSVSGGDFGVGSESS